MIDKDFDPDFEDLEDDIDCPDYYCRHWDFQEDCEIVCLCGHLCRQHGEDFCTTGDCNCAEFEEE